MDIIDEFEGHVINMGRYHGKTRNPYRIVKDVNTGETFCEMETGSGHIFKFDIEDIPKIQKVPMFSKRPTWGYFQCGYIGCTYNRDGLIYLHAHLMDHYGNGKGQSSVDHINRDKLDNRRKNLRIVEQSIQNENRGKMNRHKSAQILPEGLSQSDMPKYVVYYRECYNKEKQLYREFFTIENRQKLDKRWTTSKSNKVSLQDKLASAIAKLNEFGW
jgi:hypothetical protein